MANLDPYPGASDPNSAQDSWDRNNANIRKLEQHKRDGVNPTLGLPGQRWWRSDLQQFLHENEANQPVQDITGHKLFENLDCSGFQLVQALLEKIAAPAPSAANEGRAGYDPALKLAWLLTDTVLGYLVVSEAINGGLLIPIELSQSMSDGPATNPTWVAKNDLKGPQFDATGKQIALIKSIPKVFNGAADPIVLLRYQLDGAATNGDTVDWRLTWSSLAVGQDPASKAGTSVVVTDSVGTGSADGVVHESGISMDRADAGNPISGGELLKLIIERDTVGGAGKAGSVILHEAWLFVPSYKLGA